MNRYKIHFVDRDDTIRGIVSVVEAKTFHEAEMMVARRRRLNPERLFAELTDEMMGDR
jgi:hypothetical protein